MHILYLQQLLVLPGTPGNSRCWEFAQHWHQQGHQITFICSSAGLPSHILQELSQSDENRLIHEGIELCVVDVPYRHQMAFWKRVISFLQFYHKAYQIGKSFADCDLILAYSAPLSVIDLGRKLSLFLGKDLFLELGDVWPDVPIGMGIIQNPWLIRWLHKRTQRIYEQAKGMFPYSEGMKDQLLSHGIPENKIAVIPNGVDPHKVPFQARHPKEVIHVIYTGTIGKANDLTQLIRAIHYLEQQADTAPIQFTIIGDGNDGAKVRQIASQLSLRSLKILPRVSREEATEYLAQADIGILCFAAYSVLEANGATKFFDYLASGLPIVINYRGWQATYLKKYNCGLSSEQGDDMAFANNILQLAKDPDRRKRMGTNGRRLAEDLFSRPTLAARMLAQMKPSEKI